jgi:catechol 2,3-dioxygenase-like lactoylglutathione lyase family enzyme
MLLPKTCIRLGVDDPSRSAAFYEALLGGPPTHRSAGLAVFEFDSPPLLLTVEEHPRKRPPRARGVAGSRRAQGVSGAHGEFALVVAEPHHVGDAAIRLRRAGIPLRVEDQGIEAHDPDGNAWRVRFVPSAPGRAVVAT